MPDADLRIREATAGDIDTIMGLEEGSIEHPWTRAAIEDLINDKNKLCLVIEEDGRLIATGGLIALPIPPSFFKPQGRNGYILNMYTIPEKRHRGYASRVLHLLQEKAKEEGFEVIYLRTSEWGRPAYEKAGFQACGDWMDWTV